MGFVEAFVTTTTTIIGGSVLICFVVAGCFCGLAALLTLSDENRRAFRMITVYVSVGLCGFGILLLLRPVPFVGSLLAFWWAAILGGVVTDFLIPQAAIATLISFIFWVWQLAKSEVSFILDVSDFTIFVLVPVILTLVQLSRGAQNLASGKDGRGPQIPLHKLLSAMSDMLCWMIPADR